MGDCTHLTETYSERYEAYYCPTCFAWLEPPCSDPECSFCSCRPPCASSDPETIELPKSISDHSITFSEAINLMARKIAENN